MDRKRIRVGVVGTGFWAKWAHIPGFQSCEDVEVTAICSRNRKRVEETAQAFGIPQRFTDYESLVRLEELDVVSVCTPNDMHYPIVMAALDAGKHVLCEKPLAMDCGQAKEMYEKALRQGVKNMTFLTLRFTPNAIRMKEIIDSGYLGTVYHINVNYLQGWGADPDAPLAWRFVGDRAGTGVIGDLGPHVVDLVRWWIGEIRGVSSHVGTFIKQRKLPDSREMGEVDVDDACAFLAEFENGAQGVFHMSRIAFARGVYQHVEIYGSEGTLVCSVDFPWVGEIWGAKREDEKLKPIPIPEEMRAGLDGVSEEKGTNIVASRLAAELVESIREDRDVTPSFYDGMRAQEVLDAIQRSVEKQTWVWL